jgi:glycosyltransferase involved in cell wall biosynthesis
VDLHSPLQTSSKKPRVMVVIPAFNESGRMGRVIESIRRDLVDDIVVVDDHSTDDTAFESRRTGATYVATPRSHGVGAAIKTGYLEGLRRGADILLVLAGDDQHDPRDIPGILDPIFRGDSDYVVGDRLSGNQRGKCMSPFRLVGNQILTLATRVITGIDVRDSQCGYTAITSEGLRRLNLARITDSWGVPNDILIECACFGLRVRCVPIKARVGYRRSYIRLHAYVPRLTLILARGVFRIARARMGSKEKPLRQPMSRARPSLKIQTPLSIHYPELGY